MKQVGSQKWAFSWPLDRFDLPGWTERIRSRIFSKLLDAAMIAPLKPKKHTIGHLQTLLGSRLSNYERVASVINLVDTIVPGTARSVSNHLFRSSRLPFAGTQIELLNYGSGATVFLFKGAGETKVLKIFRRSLGRHAQGTLEVVNSYKERYQTVCAWFNGPFNLVPPATFFVLHGPLLGRPAAAMLQPYIAGEKKDLFYDFTDEEFISLMESQPGLRQQFVFFAERTLHFYRNHQLCFDFIGRENLMLVKNGDELRLLVIDVGIFEIDKLKITSPSRIPFIEEHIARLTLLKLLVEELDDI